MVRRLVALLHHVCGSQWPVRAGALLLPAETVARVRSQGALQAVRQTTHAALLQIGDSCIRHAWHAEHVHMWGLACTTIPALPQRARGLGIRVCFLNT